MKRKFAKPMILKGFLALAALSAIGVLLAAPTLPKSILPPQVPVEATGLPELVSPKTGHWLMTDGDSYQPPSLAEQSPEREGVSDLSAIGKTGGLTAEPVPGFAPGSIRLERASSALNRQTDTFNIMYIWTDENDLKVISVTSLNRQTKQAAIVVVPLQTVTDEQALVYPGRQYQTLADLYREKGREGVRTFLEQSLDLEIKSFVHVNQPALEKLSDIIGVLQVNGDRLTMQEAFEETRIGVRDDDQDVVRAVGAQILQPRMLTEVPALVGIFSHDITTNLKISEMLAIFKMSREMDMRAMRKTALPGLAWPAQSPKYLFVSEQTWKNIVWEVTK